VGTLRNYAVPNQINAVNVPTPVLVTWPKVTL